MDMDRRNPRRRPREWAGDILTEITENMTLRDGCSVTACATLLTQFVTLIEDATIERMACVADQDPDNRGRIAAALRALKHGGA